MNRPRAADFHEASIIDYRTGGEDRPAKDSERAWIFEGEWACVIKEPCRNVGENEDVRRYILVTPASTM